MGIGMASNILYEFPFPATWLKTFGTVVWGVNIALFGFSNMLFAARLLCFRDQFAKILQHHSQLAFVGCYPMALTTIINMTHNIYGQRAWEATYVMWWYAVAGALFTAWLVMYAMFTVQRREISMFNAIVLLPVVSVVVVAATGGLICQDLPVSLRESTLVVSALLLGNGEAVAFIVTTIYIYRLFMVGHDSRSVSISNFLPLGPLGQGTYAILNLAEDYAQLLLAKGQPESVANTVVHIAVGGGMLIMGYATFWIFVATATCVIRRPAAFSMGWWGLTFPLGTFATGWIKMADVTGVYAFKVLGALFGAIVLFNVLLCSALTVRFALLERLVFEQSRNEVDDQSKNEPESMPRESSSGMTWHDSVQV